LCLTKGSEQGTVDIHQPIVFTIFINRFAFYGTTIAFNFKILFEKGKAAEKQRRKATDLTPMGYDCRVADGNFLFLAPLGIRAERRCSFLENRLKANAI